MPSRSFSLGALAEMAAFPFGWVASHYYFNYIPLPIYPDAFSLEHMGLMLSVLIIHVVLYLFPVFVFGRPSFKWLRFCIGSAMSMMRARDVVFCISSLEHELARALLIAFITGTMFLLYTRSKIRNLKFMVYTGLWPRPSNVEAPRYFNKPGTGAGGFTSWEVDMNDWIKHEHCGKVWWTKVEDEKIAKGWNNEYESGTLKWTW